MSLRSGSVKCRRSWGSWERPPTVEKHWLPGGGKKTTRSSCRCGVAQRPRKALIRCQLFCPFYQKGHSPIPERATWANVRNWRPRLLRTKGVPRCFTWDKFPKRRITLQSSAFHPFHITAHTELPNIGTVHWGDVHHCELPGGLLGALAAPGTRELFLGLPVIVPSASVLGSLSIGKLT